MIARFQDTWRKHKSHGMWADGSGSANGTTYGAWLVHNTVETYFGGPLHSDLVVDGIVYNYISSNHHGDQTPNITSALIARSARNIFTSTKVALLMNCVLMPINTV